MATATTEEIERAEPGQPIYPVERSFILEFHRDAIFANAGCVGRAEHIATGTVKRFSDAADLLRFLATAAGGAPPPGAADAPASASEPTAAGESCDPGGRCAPAGGSG